MSYLLYVISDDINMYQWYNEKSKIFPKILYKNIFIRTNNNYRLAEIYINHF